MNIVKEISKLREVCTKRFLEISADGKPIFVFVIPISSKTIWGGSGDRDVDDIFYITKQGWLKCCVTTNTGIYQKGTGEVEHKKQNVSDDYIQKRLNEECELSSVETFITFYNSIKQQYGEDFNAL